MCLYEEFYDEVILIIFTDSLNEIASLRLQRRGILKCLEGKSFIQKDLKINNDHHDLGLLLQQYPYQFVVLLLVQ